MVIMECCAWCGGPHPSPDCRTKQPAEKKSFWQRYDEWRWDYEGTPSMTDDPHYRAPE